MRDFVLHALQRKREIAKKAGLWERVERIDARLAPPDPPERSATEEIETTEEIEATEEIDATDAAIELAADAGIDLADVEGSGEDGRILKGDVEAARWAGD